MKNFLRIESVAILAGSLGLYYYLTPDLSSWWILVLCAALPELGWLAYIKKGEGAAWWAGLIYNALHMYATPIFFMVVLWPYRPIYLLGWVANIAFLRVIGMGFRATKSAAAG